MSERPVVVVTGGAGALGRAVVEELLESGREVHVPWFTTEERDRLLDRVDETDHLHVVEADLSDPERVEDFFGGVREASGRLDALCNLAGGFTMAPVEKTAPAAWERMMTMNATTAFLCSRSAVPMMRDAGGGAIVNVTALPAVDRGAAKMSAYAASKSAVLSLTRSLSKELRRDGIRVNAVAPEIIDTPANREAMPDADRSTWLAPSEIARVLRFLVSEGSAVVTGSVLTLMKG